MSTEHVYIEFSEELSIEEGIQLIQDDILDGQTLQVLRIDEEGNAVVALVSRDHISSIEKLEQVSFLKVDEGAELTVSENQPSISQAVESSDNLATTTEIHVNKLDTDINPQHTPFIVAALVGLAVVFGVLFFKRNR